MPIINPQIQEVGAMPLTPIFFLIDTSGSMAGQSIEAVNTAMREAIPEIQKFARENADVAIRYSVLEFSTGAKWMTETLGYVEDFQWVDLQTSGLTALGEAYGKLNDKLSRKAGGFLQEHANNSPIIILLTDGAPTDDAASGLKLLNENKWFKHAIRIAIELPGANHLSLVEFAGGEEGVISTEPQKLRDYLKIIAINSATIGSKSQGRSNASVTGDIIKPIKPEVDIPSEPATNSNNDGDDDPFEDIFD